MTKKDAGGPFVRSRIPLEAYILFASTGSWVHFYSPGLTLDQANKSLSEWLKSTDGKKWMKKEKII